MNIQKQVQEQIQAGNEAVAKINEGASPCDLVHFVGQGDECYLSTPLPANSSLGGYTERYYTLNFIAEQGLLALKDDAFQIYVDEVRFASKYQVQGWLNSGESHKVAEALVALSWAYANEPVVAYFRKPRSQW